MIIIGQTTIKQLYKENFRVFQFKISFDIRRRCDRWRSAKEERIFVGDFFQINVAN